MCYVQKLVILRSQAPACRQAGVQDDYKKVEAVFYFVNQKVAEEQRLWKFLAWTESWITNLL